MSQPYRLANYDASLYHDYFARGLHVASLILIITEFTKGSMIGGSFGFWIIIGLATLYDLLPYLNARFEVIIRAWPTVLFHIALFIPLSIFYIPAASSMQLLGLVIVLTSTYWLGIMGYLVSGGLISATFILAGIIQDASPEEMNQIIIRGILMLIAAGFVYRYTIRDRLERLKLVQFSEEAIYERQRLQSLINSMADAVIATDREGKIQLYNGAALGLLNTNTSIGDKHFDEIIQPKTKEDDQINIIAEAKERNRIIQRDDLIFTNNLGEDINIYVDLAPVRKASDDIDGYIVLLRDITKEKSIEEQRDDFISIVSHELRTPIAITEANISTAMLPKIEEQQRIDMIKQAHINVLFLASLVNDITLLAHAERGDLDADLESIDPVALAEQLYENYKKEALDQHLELKKDIPEKLPEISTNEHRLKEVLQDLITNAIKYTEEGSVTISVKEHGKTQVRFAVTDTGIGISSSDRKKIFSKFYRSEDYRTRNHSGTGLGLFIAQKLAELIGAKIGVTSAIDKGSTFYVDVPVAK